jgi:signal transduction histidine kinase
MRLPIRYQLLVPPLILLLGVAGITTWTALASASWARGQIEDQVRHVARTLSEYPVGLSATVLRQMKGLSGADYLLIAADERLATLDARGLEPPPEAVHEDWRDLHLGPRIEVGGKTYLCSGLRLQRGNVGKTLYILYPEELWQDALWAAVRPSLILGGFAGLASLALAVGVGQRLSRRIQDLERRTRLIAAGDFSPMALPGRDDELRDLGRSVNEMAGRLAQLQETVQKTERLRLLGQVGGGLAHQLRNGITGARLAVQLHARECTGPADREALQVALRQLSLLETTVRCFLDLGRAEVSQREPCLLTALLDEVVTLLRPQCQHTHVELRWQTPKDEFVVQADAGRLQQLFHNILYNAIEAAGPGGWVAIDLRRVRRTAPAADGCVIEVADSGPGPSPEVAARLFEPFVTSKPEGVGLGLAVARQVAQAHGGRLDWRREKDRTVFRIELPLDPCA